MSRKSQARTREVFEAVGALREWERLRPLLERCEIALRGAQWPGPVPSAAQGIVADLRRVLGKIRRNGRQQVNQHTWTDPKTKVRYTAVDKPIPRLEVAGQVVSWDSPVIRELFRQVERAETYERLAESCSDAASKHLARIGVLEKELRETREALLSMPLYASPKEFPQVVRSGWVDPETAARYLKALATLKSSSLSYRLQELESEVAIIKSRLEKETA